MFTITILETLLFEGRSVVWPANPLGESQEVKGLNFQWKTKKSSVFAGIAWKAIAFKSLGVFEWLLIFFDFVQNFQTRKNWKTQIAKTYRIVFKKRSVEAIFTTTILEILLFVGRLLFWSAQPVTRSERVEVSKYLLEKLKSK